MAITLDGVLGFAIPAGVIIFFFVLVFDKIKEPIMRFFLWIGGLFGAGAEAISETTTLRDAHLNYGR